MKKKKERIVVVVSGGFDPFHIGHVRLFKEAKELGDTLAVVLNGDGWLVRKKGKYFMTAKDRAEVIKALRCVDRVYIHNSARDDVIGALKKIKPNIFANGGDRNAGDIPEYEFCRKNHIQMVFNVGGSKVRSSSELLKRWSG